MEKILISDVFKCNQVIFKLMEQQQKFPISIGIKLFNISKKLDEVEDYVFNVMNLTFGENDFSFDNMSEDERKFFNRILNEEIELDFEKIPSSAFENNDEVVLTIEEIGQLSKILEEKS